MLSEFCSKIIAAMFHSVLSTATVDPGLGTSEVNMHEASSFFAVVNPERRDIPDRLSIITWVYYIFFVGD